MRKKTISMDPFLVHQIHKGLKTLHHMPLVPQPTGMLEWFGRKKTVAQSSPKTFAEAMIPHCPYGEALDRLKIKGHKTIIQITDVTVVRLHDITEDECIDEGLDKTEFLSARESFKNIWEEIYSDTQNAWDYNPWCWKIRFRRVAP